MDHLHFSIDRKERLLQLKAKRGKFLKQKEETLRKKSRGIWLQVGDNNSNFFHRLTNQRRLTNSILEIKIEKGDIGHDQKYLRSATVNGFKILFSQHRGFNLENPLNTIKNFPHLFEREDCVSIGNPITLEEVKNTLNMFAKDKIPGPDGWTVELYLHFFVSISA